MAAELERLGHLGAYYSGYPRWKLRDLSPGSICEHSFRTKVVYGALKYLPASLRPPARKLFRWQDRGFDRWVGAHLATCDFLHAMPGQCLQTFRAARRRGIPTVLNHATGPVRAWVRIMEPEFARAGLRLTDVCPYDDDYFAREDEEYALADWHCAASSVVRGQLLALGIDAARIWQVPYGADERFFHRDDAPPPEDFRIVFAGQVGLRKGLRTLLEALTLAGQPRWRLDFYGAVAPESQRDLAAYRGATALHFHGAVAQSTLGSAFRAGSVLVLPSLEEGFGLVVPQALNCGLPALVSDRVGGRDLIRHRDNGSIFPTENAAALAAEFAWWAEHPRRVVENFSWRPPAEKLIQLSTAACA